MLEHFHHHLVEAGCDEAGRGCLAGPVVASAVILPKSFRHPMLNDSKALKPKEREYLRKIIEQEALDYKVAFIDNQIIDEINILQASFEAMHDALDALTLRPEIILVDGNRFKPYLDVTHECIIKGDSKILSIAAASILAKTYRDDYMRTLHLQFPQYHWDNNKGYPTKIHKQMIQEYGLTDYHRKTYKINFIK